MYDSLGKIRELVYSAYNSAPRYKEIVAGLPEDYKSINTLGQLLEINYKYVSVDDQLRRNLIEKRREGKNPYPGIIGYDDVIAATDRAILAGHDILYIGKIGQAKTKLAETIARSLLSPIPTIKGCIIHDIPLLLPEDELVNLLSGNDTRHTSLEFHICNDCEYKIRDHRLDTEIEWVDGMARYRYVLATPDISIKDLVGQIDAVKIARGASLYSIESYSPGQLLQARHGILCIDELPVLDPRKQVVLLSVLQEGRFTTGSYPVIFKPYVRVIATANPIDYTHASKIIEPLLDRFESHIITHYPYTVRDEMAVMVQEARIIDSRVFLPVFILKLLARITHLAREHPDVNKDKGVSVRMSIHTLELIVSEAIRVRALHNNNTAVPRISDIHAIYPAAKFELSEIEDSSENRRRVLEHIIDEALRQIALEYVSDLTLEQITKVKNEFKGNQFIVSQSTLWSDGKDSYSAQLSRFTALKEILDNALSKVTKEQDEILSYIKGYGIDAKTLVFDGEDDSMYDELSASLLELVLEGLRSLKPPILDRKESIYVLS